MPKQLHFLCADFRLVGMLKSAVELILLFLGWVMLHQLFFWFHTRGRPTIVEPGLCPVSFKHSQDQDVPMVLDNAQTYTERFFKYFFMGIFFQLKRAVKFWLCACCNNFLPGGLVKQLNLFENFLGVETSVGNFCLEFLFVDVVKFYKGFIEAFD